MHTSILFFISYDSFVCVYQCDSLVDSIICTSRTLQYTAAAESTIEFTRAKLSGRINCKSVSFSLFDENTILRS